MLKRFVQFFQDADKVKLLTGYLKLFVAVAHAILLFV
jgi:hypothetical protein